MNRIPKLVAERLHTQAPGPHPEPDVLSAFAENALSRDERRPILSHLSACAACREIVYLAQPTSAEATSAVLYTPNRKPWLVWRWAGLAASVVIVAGGAFLVRHELISDRLAAVNAPANESYAKVSSEKAPSEKVPAELGALGKQADVNVPEVAKKNQSSVAAITERSRPEAKHMTAKPQAQMLFDKNGQVNLVVPSSRDAETPTAEPSARRENQIAAKELPLPAPTVPTANPRGAGSNGLDEVTVTGASEAVEVSAGTSPAANSPQVGGTDVANQSSHGAVAGAMKTETAKAKPGTASAFSSERTLQRAVVFPHAQWMITPAGEVQRSFDHGKTWQNVTVGNGVNFRAVFSSGGVVWAGGNGGTLYRSSDSGLNWTQVMPLANGEKLTGDVVHIEFADSMNGSVSTANGESWLTSDGGQSWRKK